MTSDLAKALEQLGEMLRAYDEIQLELLSTHIGIHRMCIRRIAENSSLSVKEVPRKKFMQAVEDAFSGDRFSDMRNVLQLLDSARNEFAHSQDPALYTEKLSKFREAVFPGESVAHWSERDAKTREALATVWHWVLFAGA